jgi:hypothetical protein
MNGYPRVRRRLGIGPANIARRIGSGNVGQASTTLAKSGSIRGLSVENAPDFAALEESVCPKPLPSLLFTKSLKQN